jgi:hypothetical protein
MMAAAWIGCNAILGNESAVFAPEQSETGVPVDGSPNVDATNADARIDDDAGPCVDTSFNPRHCGSCFHDCLGGACVSGTCQPLELVTEEGAIEGILLDATHVYWSNTTSGTIKRARLADRFVETIFDGADGVGVGHRFALHEGVIYFAKAPLDAPHSVLACPVTGCGSMPQTVLTDLANPNAVDVVDGTLLVTQLGGTVGQCTLPCDTGLVPIAEGESYPIDATKDGTTVVWSLLTSPSGGQIRVKVGNDAPFTARSGINPYTVALVGEEIVYADIAVGVKAMQLDGGAFRSISRTQTKYMAIDTTGVYFTNNSTIGGVYQCPLSGCLDGGPPLASNQPNPDAIAIDDKSVVWVNTGSTPAILRIAK